MKNIWTIIKKELARVFTDKRMLFSLFLLPPLTIYLIYGLMGMSAEKEQNNTEQYHPTIYVYNAPEEISNQTTIKAFEDYIYDVQRLEIKKENGSIVRNDAGDPIYEPQYVYFRGNENQNVTIHYVDDLTTLEAKKEELKNGKFDLIIVFSENFVGQVENYQNETSFPNITLHYNINSTYSQAAHSNFSYILSNYKTSILNSRFTESGLIVFEQINMAQGDVNKAKGSILGMLLPLLLIIYLMAGAMGIGIESISGEKERGTIATLLVTPIKRSQLAIGKIISIAIIAVLSSITSFIGLLAVLPSFNKINGGEDSIGGVAYTLSDYGMILAIMLVSVLLFVALIVIVSTYAKTVKEAGVLIMPIYLVVMGASMFNMFTQNVSKEVTSYIIPVYNVVLALKAVFQFDLTAINFTATIISTLIYTLLLTFLIQKMFKSEKIMFNK